MIFEDTGKEQFESFVESSVDYRLVDLCQEFAGHAEYFKYHDESTAIYDQLKKLLPEESIHLLGERYKIVSRYFVDQCKFFYTRGIRDHRMLMNCTMFK